LTFASVKPALGAFMRFDGRWGLPPVTLIPFRASLPNTDAALAVVLVVVAGAAAGCRGRSSLPLYGLRALAGGR
jgi:hypothetical protein